MRIPACQAKAVHGSALRRRSAKYETGVAGAFFVPRQGCAICAACATHAAENHVILEHWYGLSLARSRREVREWHADFFSGFAWRRLRAGRRIPHRARTAAPTALEVGYVGLVSLVPRSRATPTPVVMRVTLAATVASKRAAPIARGTGYAPSVSRARFSCVQAMEVLPTPMRRFGAARPPADPERFAATSARACVLRRAAAFRVGRAVPPAATSAR
jgi:hypothetical protein